MTITDGGAPSNDSATSEERIVIRVQRPLGDRVYRAVVRTAGSATLILMALIGTFLLVQSLPALRSAHWSFLTQTEWNPDASKFGIATLLLGTVLIAIEALLIAVPLAVGAALFVSEYAPPRLRRPITSVVDLLAAVPSLIYGLWGRFFLQPRLVKVSDWLSTHVAFVPIFKTKTTLLGGTTFIAGFVVAIMVLPLCTAIFREVFAQAPPGEKEGALALGGTRWGMIRTVVLPFGRGGIIGGSMLGLGRALGETIAVALIISPIYHDMVHILDRGGNSISALIALRFGESTPFGINALMAAGLVLFVVTLIVNAFASVIVSRSRSGQATEI
ncbi:MAG: phosphate ABC transporter permease subunit PstC [Actinomycetota bacterium]|nr:phosphate ABC transporter permease subunit PstC [Actinomycetota bacterium]